MTVPATEQEQEEAARHLVLAPSVEIQPGDRTEIWVHKDYQLAHDAFEDEGHIGPVAASERFGDLDSWAEYLRLYGPRNRSFITWNAKGMRAILDYHDRVADGASEVGGGGRAAWIAEYPYVPTPEWQAWRSVATGAAIPHAKAVEFLDDRLGDIVEPASTVLLNILRKLKANTTATAETELRQDGTAHIRFEKNDKVTTEGEVDLPPEFEILVPVLKGHTDDEGRPVNYRLVVKLRVSITESRLSLRFTLPAQERVLEQVYSDMLTSATALLGEGFTILRAAD